MPYPEVVFLQVEDVELLIKELIEVAKHEGGLWLMPMFKIVPMEVGLDGWVCIDAVKVQFE